MFDEPTTRAIDDGPPSAEASPKVAPAAAEPRSTLTPEQEQAVARRRGPLLLSAGAGSGKTAVLVERFVRAIREDGISPGRIMAITFTERAAAELRERVRARLLELGERQAARDVEGAPVGTFHGFCARLLRTHALAAGLDPELAILDEPDAERLRALAFRHAMAALLAQAAMPADSGALAQPLRSAAGGRVQASAGERRWEAVELLAAYGTDRVRAMLLGVHAEQRSRGIALPTLPNPAVCASAQAESKLLLQTTLFDRSGETLAFDRRESKVADRPDAAADPLEGEALRACALLGELLESFGRRYAALKRARAALDFDDLELRARELLESYGGIRETWRERIELLMVDEFQDTNRRQLALLELLERDNLFTVGDEQQSIYGFRRAEVEIFRERRRALSDAGAALVLAHNFRARPVLIAAVNHVFGERFGEAHAPLKAAREEAEGGAPRIELLLTDKQGWAESPHAESVAGALPRATLWRQAEARLLAQRVAELIAAGSARAGDVAVLLRAASDLPVYERALEECGVRTLAAVGSFWGHQQVGDLLAWLRALANPLDELALYSALASPLVGISSDGLALIAMRARAAGVGAWAAIARGAGAAMGGEDGPREPCAARRHGELYDRLAPADRERVERFVRRFADERRLAAILGPAELLVRAVADNAVADNDYERHVLALSSGERRLANVHKLLRLARRYEATEGPDLRGFLDHVAHRRAYAERAEPHAPTGSDPDAVRLMTIHAAKGLEFPVVCVADLGRAAGGSTPDLLVDGERVGLRLARLDGSPAVACLHYAELAGARRRADAAEEERIVYVALTRARERLLLSGACDFGRWARAAPIGDSTRPTPRTAGAAGGSAQETGNATGVRGSANGSDRPPIEWLAPALVPALPALVSDLQSPVVDLAMAGDGEGEERIRVRCWLNASATVGRVLR